MKIRLKCNTDYGESGEIVERNDKAFLAWVKKNGSLIDILEDKKINKKDRAITKVLKTEQTTAKTIDDNMVVKTKKRKGE